MELAQVAATIECAIVEEVKGELERDPTRGRSFAGWIPTSNLKVLSIAIGSVAEKALEQLEIHLETARGHGERASIALAATDPRLVFTGMDKNGMWIALRELWGDGERLVGYRSSCAGSCTAERSRATRRMTFWLDRS